MALRMIYKRELSRATALLITAKAELHCAPSIFSLMMVEEVQVGKA
jgi:hypothetical protein